MAVSQLRRVISVECPACHRTKAVLADKNSSKRSFSCPHCQHVWDTTEIAHEERVRINHGTTELRQEHRVSVEIDCDLDRRVAEVVAHVRRTLALLHQEARVRLPAAIVPADMVPPRLRERFFKDALPHDILKTKPLD